MLKWDSLVVLPGLILVALFGLVATGMIMLRPDPLQSKFAQIQNGMSQDEVYAILGWPGAYCDQVYSTKELDSSDQIWIYLSDEHPDARRYVNMWFTERGVYVVRFDRLDHVKEHRFCPRHKMAV